MHHLRRIRMSKVPLCWSRRLGQSPSSQQAVLSTIIIQLLILQIVSHRPSRPEKRIDSRTTTTKLSFCPGSRPDFRTTIEILRSRPEKLAKSRTNSSFCPSHPEKHLDSRTAIEILKSHPEKRIDFRTAIWYQQKCACGLPSDAYVPVWISYRTIIFKNAGKTDENECKHWIFR